MIRRIHLLLFLAGGLAGLAAEPPPPARTTLVIVEGAGGEPEFAAEFRTQADTWERLGRSAGADVRLIGRDAPGGPADRERLEAALAAEPREGLGELWLVLLGHGTFDGKEARFNLRGADATAAEFAAWLRPIRRPVAVIDAASCSAPFLAALSDPGRVVVTATRSGFQQNYARFGKFLAAAMADPAADLDRDGQVSLLEGFLAASHRTAEFYQTENRLATEHALLDDNGDGLGTPADWFQGVRAVKRAKEGAAVDGLRAHQFHLVRSTEEQALAPEVRARRDGLEREVARWRERKDKLLPAEYADGLERLLLQLAELAAGGPAPAK